MASNTPISSSKVRESLRNIPDDLFDDPNRDVKVHLIQRQFTKDPIRLALLIKRMINESK